MGIQVEFNPDLALRKYGTKDREPEECLPEILIKGNTHEFLKKGQRNYWLEGEIPLLETKGNQKISKPIASIRIIETTHFSRGNIIYTRGLYQIVEVCNDNKIYFNGFSRT